MFNQTVKTLTLNAGEIIMKNGISKSASGTMGTLNKLNRHNSTSSEVNHGEDVSFYKMVEVNYDRASAIVEDKIVEES